jgi:Skp family chaperone for outer membrane proteins
MNFMLNRSVVTAAVIAIVAGGSAVLAASLLPAEVAQTPLIEKQRIDEDYRQRQDYDKSQSDEAAEAARLRAEDDARRRAADYLRQREEDAIRQQQNNQLDKRFRSDQPQPYRPRSY